MKINDTKVGSDMKKILSLFIATMMAASSVATTAFAAEEKPVIKNVIYMIPDGGGFALFDLANGVKEQGGFNEGLYPNSTKVTKGPMNMKDYLVGTERTRSANYAITDSAAGGTALSSGYRTNNKYLGVDPEGVPHATILEAAQLAGKRVGMCTTYEWSNATPASFSSHHISREDRTIISEQIVNQDIDVVLGVGFGSAKWGNIDEAVNRGYTVVNTKKQLENVEPGTRVWGNLSSVAFPFDINLTASQPTLAEMTTAAIRALEGDKDGFFLMVEGSAVDGGGHANNVVQAVSEYLSFDAAFAVALEYAKGRNDTVVIAAPDHDTGGLNLPNADPVGGSVNREAYADAIAEVQAGKNSKKGISWTSDSHTARNCGVWFYGPEGVDILEGLSQVPGDTADKREDAYVIENYQIAPYLCELLGLDLEAASEELFVDVTELGEYDADESTFTFDKYSFDDTELSIKANQSVAMLNGKTVDLNGEVAVYSNGRFYVPRRVLDLRSQPEMDNKEARFTDAATGKVLVKGQVGDAAGSEIVTLLLVKKGSAKVTKEEIGYVAQTRPDGNGNYSFAFTFKGNMDEYELRMMLDGEVVTDTVTAVEVDYSWVDTAVNIYQNDEENVSCEVRLNNYSGVENLTYRLGLIFFDENNNLIDFSVGQDNDVEKAVTVDNHTTQIPEGTASIKAFVWSDFTSLIPLCEYDIVTK